MQRKYSTKFKQYAIQKVAERGEHQTIMDVALTLGINLSTLKNWLKLSRRENAVQEKSSDTQLHEEIQYLKAELLRKDQLIVETTALLVRSQKQV